MRRPANQSSARIAWRSGWARRWPPPVASWFQPLPVREAALGSLQLLRGWTLFLLDQLQHESVQTAHLDEIVRQRDPELRAIVEHLRGDIHSAVERLDQQGRV